jgi:hypothetical protein
VATTVGKHAGWGLWQQQQVGEASGWCAAPSARDAGWGCGHNSRQTCGMGVVATAAGKHAGWGLWPQQQVGEASEWCAAPLALDAGWGCGHRSRRAGPEVVCASRRRWVGRCERWRRVRRAGPALSPCSRGDGQGPKSNKGPIFSIYITI